MNRKQIFYIAFLIIVFGLIVVNPEILRVSIVVILIGGALYCFIRAFAGIYKILGDM